MPSYMVTLETRTLNRQKTSLEIAGCKHGVNLLVELRSSVIVAAFDLIFPFQIVHRLLIA